MDDKTFQFVDRRIDRSEDDLNDNVTACAEGRLYLTFRHVSMHNGISFDQDEDLLQLLTD